MRKKTAILHTFISKRIERKLRAAARRGAKRLDATIPDWFKPHHFSLAKFDIGNCELCIAGQLRAKASAERHPSLVESMSWFDPKLGFNNPDDVEPSEWNAGWDILQDEWEKQIKQRRAAAKAAA